MATHPSQQMSSQGGLVGLIRRHPISAFFILSYAVTWLLWSPIVLLGLPAFNEATNAPYLYTMPGVAIGVTGTAFLMTAITQGRAGVRRLLQRLTSWRVGLQWWAVAVLLFPLTALLVAVLLGSPDALNALRPSSLLLYPAAYFAHFFFGPLVGTLCLGLLWSTWHFFLYAPIWFGSGNLAQGLLGVGSFVMIAVSLSSIFTWLFNNTQGSLLLAILLHGSVDGSNTYFGVLGDRGIISDAAAGNYETGVMFGSIVLALVLVAATRGKLSYRRYQQGAEPLDLSPATGRPGATATT